MNSKEISIAAILAALYVVIGLQLPFLSFGPIQCRVSDALYPLIHLTGTSGLVGLTLGHLIYNTYGYTADLALGWMDLFSPMVLLPGKYLIKEYGWKGVIVHTLMVGLWVAYLLNQTYALPLNAGFVSVTAGEAVAELGLGYVVYKAVEKYGKDVL